MQATRGRLERPSCLHLTCPGQSLHKAPMAMAHQRVGACSAFAAYRFEDQKIPIH